MTEKTVIIYPFTDVQYIEPALGSPGGQQLPKRILARRSITDDMLAESASVPVGVPMAYGGITLPIGFLWCDGSTISRLVFPKLFSVIGTSFGVGDGVTTFDLPDQAQKGIVGYDVSDGEYNAVGKEIGSKSITPSTVQVATGTDETVIDGQTLDVRDPSIVWRYIIKY